MTTYFTSDLHFNHNNIIIYCNRPWQTVADMNAALITNINNIVKPDDKLVIIGDFAMGPKKDRFAFRKLINCRVVLVRGNHDEAPIGTWLNAGFDEVYDSYLFDDPRYGKILCEHVPNRLNDADIQLCGHVHQQWVTHKPNIVNVGVDVHNFTPKTLDELAMLLLPTENT